MKKCVILFIGLMILPACGCCTKEIDSKQTVRSVTFTSITLTPEVAIYDLTKVTQGVVGFSAIIKNEGPETITIAHPSMCLPADYKPGESWNISKNRGKSEILLMITKPDGTNSILRDGWMHGFDPNNVGNLTIPPGGTQTFSLGWFFLNARGRWENDAEAATTFLGKGTYKVRIILRNAFPRAFVYNMGASKPEVVSVWTGEMQSEEVTVEIK